MAHTGRIEHMFENWEAPRREMLPPDAGGARLPATMASDGLRTLLRQLRAVDGSGASEAELIDQIAAMEELKAGLAAAQARVTCTLSAERKRAEAERGICAAHRGRGLGSEVALARHASPTQGARHLGFATAMTEMPHTMRALESGRISEWSATVLVRETAILSREHRAEVDAELADRISELGPRQLGNEARKIGYRLDPGSAIRRVRGAQADRHVSLRPAPDTMAWLTGLLPVADGVACKVVLDRAADAAKAQGDERSRGQIMADTLIGLITGRETGTQQVHVQLVMSDSSLFGVGDDHEPAHVSGHGPIPAALARDLIRDADRAWVTRLFASPKDGELVAMDARSRLFVGRLRDFLITRDDVCRTPWCDAPIRHIDHVRPHAAGGPTSADNGQGLCQTCNQTKEVPGWRAERDRSRVTTTTPTGHRYRSRPPRPPGVRPSRRAVAVELYVTPFRLSYEPAA